jgi:hypothetical protein
VGEPALTDKPEALEAAELAEAKAETPAAAVETPAADAELDARGDPSVPPKYVEVTEELARAAAGKARPQGRARSTVRGQHFSDAVTLLEIAPSDAGGVREKRLPGDRAQSPLSPLPARRTGWGHPVLRWTAYIAFTLALTALLIWLLIDLFHLG